MKTITVDVESYPNYFLAKFKNSDSGRTVSISHFGEGALSADSRAKLKQMMRAHITVGFNSLNYDLPMITAAIAGRSINDLHIMGNAIITDSIPSWRSYDAFGLVRPNNWNHIDLEPVAFGVKVSLKLYGGRLAAPKLQDLPIEPSTTISEQDAAGLDTYCENDLDTTQLLLDSLAGEMALRATMSEQYGTDLRSKSDAQIAEAVFKSELEKARVKVKKAKLPKNYAVKFNLPNWIAFGSAQLAEILNTVTASRFVLDGAGKPKLPKELDKAFEFNGKKYKFGIGGLHSQEKKQVVKCAPDEMLFDIDVASYYPNIILGQGLYPKHLGAKFLGVYKSVVDRRIAAKRSGDKVVAGSLKITINGAYGKFGSPYSFLYSPDLLLQTTLTGQLSLLMLIERVEKYSNVVSANTDGIVVHCKKSDYQKVYAEYCQWEFDTGFELEQTDYRALYSRDVNNYAAIGTDGKVKGKGIFASAGMGKNPATPVCYDAVKAHLLDGTPLAETIKAESDVTRFLTVRTVNGGATWKGELIGKVVRWYYSTEGETIHYKKNGNKVPKSDGAKPMQDLAEKLPKDLDTQWYIDEAQNILESLGC